MTPSPPKCPAGAALPAERALAGQRCLRWIAILIPFDPVRARQRFAHLLAITLLTPLTLQATLTESELQRLIDGAIRSGGGEVRIPAGTIHIEKGLRIANAHQLRLSGSEGHGTVLKLPPLAFAESAGQTPAGATRIAIRRRQGFQPGTQLRIETLGELDAFTKQPKPYVLARVRQVQEDALLLDAPLKFPVPPATLIRHEDAPNLIEILDASDEVRIENLVLDGGRVAGDPPVRGHAQLCGIYAHGKYTYEAGPIGPQPSRIVIRGCLIRNCHGRGVAFYSVADSEISGCEISDTTDEAIDLDHFTVRTQVMANQISRSLAGVELNDASNCLVVRNRFAECRTGINLWQFCRLPGLNEGNRIECNRFEHTRGNPLQIQPHLTKNLIQENIILPLPAPAPGTATAGGGPWPGLAYVEFQSATLSRPAGSGIDTQIDLDTGNRIHDYSRLWLGSVRAPLTGELTFSAEADNGCRLTVLGHTLIDGWTQEVRDGRIAVRQGQLLPVRLEFFQNGGNAHLRLHWSWPGHPRHLIPATAFSHSAADKAAIARILEAPAATGANTPARIPERAATPASLFAADYLLPVYVNLQQATLLVRPSAAFNGGPATLRVTFQPRQGGTPPRGDLQATLKPGEDWKLAVPIGDWTDGDYRTEIRASRDGQPLGQPLVRWLRKQTIPAPPLPAEPVDVRGLTTLFVDDEYIHLINGLSRAVNPAEPFAVTTSRMAPDRPEQKPVGGIQLAADGTWLVKFTDTEREDRVGATTRHYTARSRDARHWTVAEDEGGSANPRQIPSATVARETSPPRFRDYDPAADGPADIRQVRLRRTGIAKDVRWGELAMPERTAFPVWEKSPSEHLILTRQPLLRDKHDHADGEPCDWQDTNDNYLNDFFSPDGRTLFDGQSRMILRHDPFRIPFDVFQEFPGGHYNRIMTVWRSQDGLHWTPTCFDPQREEDPVSYQGYGAKQFYVEGKRLSLGYFFAYRALPQQVCVELRSSRDNIHWQRLPGSVDDHVFAANGPWGSWNFGYMFGVTGDPVERDGWMYQLFASCQNVPHHFFRKLLGFDPKIISDPAWLRTFFAANDLPSYPYWKEMGGWDGFARQAASACRPIGGMRYRKDGWVTLRPAGGEGELTTKVLLAGERLAINARTQPGGQVRVEVLDAASHPLPGYSGANAASFTGDSVNAPLAWANGGLPTLPAQPVRLHIQLRRAELFALHWR